MAFKQNPYSQAALDCTRCATTGMVDGQTCKVCSGLGKIAAVAKRRFMGLDDLPPEPAPVQSDDDALLASLFTPGAAVQVSKSGRVHPAPGSGATPNRDELEAFIRAGTWSDFLQSLASQLTHRGSLTDNQWRAAASIMQERTRRDGRQVGAGQARLPNIRAMFTTAMRGGSFRADRATFCTLPLTLTATPSRTNLPSIIFIRDVSTRMIGLGKIVGEVFFPKVNPAQQAEVTLATLIRVNEDPSLFATSYGRALQVCACCGERLAGPQALEACIHPHCARDWGI